MWVFHEDHGKFHIKCFPSQAWHTFQNSGNCLEMYCLFHHIQLWGGQHARLSWKLIYKLDFSCFWSKFYSQMENDILPSGSRLDNVDKFHKFVGILTILDWLSHCCFSWLFLSPHSSLRVSQTGCLCGGVPTSPSDLERDLLLLCWIQTVSITDPWSGNQKEWPKGKLEMLCGGRVTNLC